MSPRTRRLVLLLTLVGTVVGLAPPANAAVVVTAAPYVDMGAWPTPSMSDMAVKGKLKSFTMGFVTAWGCKASWFGAYDPRTGWQADEIAKIRAAGGDVKVSFGGASGIELAQNCSTVTSLANEYDAVVKAYKLNYIDLDIEGAAVADPASIQRRSQAQIKSLYGLADAAAWKKIGVTPMLGVNDSRNEIFYTSDATQLVNFAKSVHLGMLSFWEMTRDRNACNGSLVNCTNVPQQPYEFSKIFGGYTG